MSAHVGFATVLRRRGFRRLAAAHGLATLGQLVLTLAVGAHVAATASPVWASVAVSLGFLPYAVFSSLAGVLADRVSRSGVLAWSALVRSVLAAGVYCAAALGWPVPVLVGLATLAAVAATPSYPALVAATHECVEDDELAAANALVTCVENTSWLAGPGIFGLLLLAGLDASGLALAAALALVAGGALALPVRLPAPARTRHEGLRAELTAGLSEVVRRAEVRRPMALAMLDNFLYGYLVAALVLLAVDPGGQGRVGWLETALTFGALLAAPWVDRLTRWRGASGVLTAALGLSAAAVAVLGLVGPHTAVHPLLPLVALAGAGLLVAEVAAVTLLQRSCDPGRLARVFGVYDQLNVGAIALGSVLAGPLAHVLGAGPAAVAVGVAVAAVLAALRLRVRPVNRRTSPTASDLGWRPCPPTSSSSLPSTSRVATPSSSSRVLPAQRRPSGTPSTLR